jgi:uncharacterized protein YyaL (SSP411 family)
MRQCFPRYALMAMMAICAIGCSGDRSPNELAEAASPYLREHADNPVHWVEWSDNALQRAKEQNKPVIVSIGYASCHWCHVMERESFMDTAVARIMNRDFICIKVDREERPDLDQVYIRAAEMLSGNAGWPLNAFALPDGRPFYAATYFQKGQWLSLLEQVSVAYRNDFANLEKQAIAVQQNITGEENKFFASSRNDTSRIASFLRGVPAWVVQLDMEHGGLKGQNRFPMPVIGEFFLQHYYLTGDTTYRNWVTTTLDEMARGGIYDQLGGGFSRYTVDPYWRFPHFEKMLYDNGQLVSLYSHAYQESGDSLYLAVINETLGFISAELTSPEGAFYSSINADSEGEEGKFYAWDYEEIGQVVRGYATSFVEMYGVIKMGNWELGKNILYIPADKFSLAKRAELASARRKLLDVRNRRVRPTRDEKILAAWNAMMLNGYVDAFKATGNRSYLETAVKNAEFMQNYYITEQGEVYHSLRLKGEPVSGFLDDYVWMAKAFINLYEATLDLQWLTSARLIADQSMKNFKHDKANFFFYSPYGLPNPITRKMEVYDNVIPSSNSVLAEVLFRLSEYFQEASYEVTALNAMTAAASSDPAMGLYLTNWARIAEVSKLGPYEVAVMGEDAVPQANVLQRTYLPSAFFMGGDAEDLPLLEQKLIAGKTIIYVCRNGVCKLPTENPVEALSQLRRK